jgi:aspartate racemase
VPTPTVGIVGGLGPESTVDYYKRIIDGWQRHDRSSAPPIVIDSLDAQLALRLAATDRGALTDYLAASLTRLTRAGVDFAVLTANTAHLVFDELAGRTSVPLISIVEVCAGEAKRQQLGRLLLLGTRFTMEASFYPEVFARHGLTVVAPNASDREWVHDRYVNQLLRGEFRDETRADFVTLIDRLRDEYDLHGVILGGTELPLLLRAPTIAGLPTLDTTALHVDAILERLR